LGVPVEELLGQTIPKLAHTFGVPEEQKRIICRRYARALYTHQPFSTYELSIPIADQTRHFEIKEHILYGPEGTHIGTSGVLRDITQRKHTEEILRRRNRQLALLNQAGQAFSSTLDLDQVLTAVLQEVRSLLGITGATIGLVELDTRTIICRQSVGPQEATVRGSRLLLGEGIAGLVAERGRPILVPDTRESGQYYTKFDEQTGLEVRSMLGVPLRTQRETIGVLIVFDQSLNRFDETDQALLESLATTAAIAIENARLYEQSRRDAEKRQFLLHEVNHRVKNNLAAIIGLLYAERRHVEHAENPHTYRSIMTDLVSRVKGLATVHTMLSNSDWAPLPLSTLATQVIQVAIQVVPTADQLQVTVDPATVQVTADQAHSLALVINELSTNAAKHAAPHTPQPHIEVRFREHDSGIELEFRDNGPGYPEAVLRWETYHVGFDLIRNIVESNLQGQVILRNDGGAVAEIRFPTK
jgi:two-component sensor histidine kinase